VLTQRACPFGPSRKFNCDAEEPPPKFLRVFVASYICFLFLFFFSLFFSPFLTFADVVAAARDAPVLVAHFHALI
jgi:hypothetical protein